MDSALSSTINKFYNGLLDKHGAGTIDALGWNGSESQQKRFEVLAGIGDMNGKTILDVGCGYGDFLEYIKDRKNIEHYTGIDVNPRMIDEAKKRHDIHSYIVSLEKGTLEEWRDYHRVQEFDYVVASGIFAVNMTNMKEYVRSTLEMMFRRCKAGVAVNFLSNYPLRVQPRENFDRERERYVCRFWPGEILKIADKISTRYVLRNDYKENDFTVYIYRRAE